MVTAAKDTPESQAEREQRTLLRRAALCGGSATVPWLSAAVGWTAHWNVYICLALTLAGGVLWFSLLAVTMDRYQKKAQ